MKVALSLTAIAAIALAGCGGPEDGSAATAAGNVATNGAPAVAPPATPTPTPTPTTAEQYVARASAGDLFAMLSAQLALDKSDSAEVRGLAQMILSDHRRASARLADAAREAEPPIAPAPVLDPAQQAAIEALRQASGVAFDEAWLRQQVDAHEQALDLAAAFATRGDSEPLRRQAAATIAPIQTHLTRARRLEAEALARPDPERQQEQSR